MTTKKKKDSSVTPGVKTNLFNITDMSPGYVPSTERTTFKLSEETIKILDEIVEYFGSSTKDALSLIIDSLSRAEGINKMQHLKDVKDIAGGVRKTFVLTSEALQKLTSLAEKNSISRDALLTEAILMAHSDMQTIKKFREKVHNEVYQDVRKIYLRAEDLRAKVDELIPWDDPMKDAVCMLATYLMNADQEFKADEYFIFS